jgi:superfamily II DNA/RNA helicase
MQTKSINQRFGKTKGSNRHGAERSNKFFYSKSSDRKRAPSRSRNIGENIDISRFIQKSSNVIAEKTPEIRNTFADFRLCGELTNNLKKRNFSTPAPIQDQAIEHILDGRDVIGIANTGTGKTAAFLLPLIDKVYNDKSQKVLIITPTRELALQIENELRLFSWGMKIFFASCVGGLPIFKQINNLKRNPNFVIGTPGRLKDLSERNILKFGSFNNVVLDEVDRMLDMGFIDEIRGFLNELPEERQSLFFSATIPAKIRDLVGTFLNNPVTIDVKSGETPNNVDQNIVRVTNKGLKFNQLHELLSQPELSKVLIFIETKRAVEKLTVDLVKEGFKAESIHGDKSQGQRQRALASFKNNAADILVATDVAARGLDIKNVSHVINYTVPQTYNDYIHRIGRTGRGSSTGKALTFVEA